jgi:hypothetical protein
MKANDLEEAYHYYTKSIALDSSLAPAYANRGLVCIKLERYSREGKGL